MATFTIFHETMNKIGTKLINLSADTFKALLSNTAPVQATGAVKADISEIASGNGYTSGGFTLTSTFTETGSGTGVWRFQSTGSDPFWTASGGDIAAHRYLVVYDDTATNDELIGYVDGGTSSTIVSGNTRTWDIGASGLFEISTTP
jgi:hypothetical protein